MDSESEYSASQSDSDLNSESEQDVEEVYGIGEKQKRETSRQNNMKGRARGTWRLCRSRVFQRCCDPSQLEGVSKYWSPALVEIAEDFRRLTHHGSETVIAVTMTFAVILASTCNWTNTQLNFPFVHSLPPPPNQG